MDARRRVVAFNLVCCVFFCFFDLSVVGCWLLKVDVNNRMRLFVEDVYNVGCQGVGCRVLTVGCSL